MKEGLTNIERDKHRPIPDQLRPRCPPLRDELIRAFKASSICLPISKVPRPNPARKPSRTSKHRIRRYLHNDIPRNEPLPHPHPLRGRHALRPRRNRRMQPHRLIDDRVQQPHRHQMLMRQVREGIQLHLQTRHQFRIVRQVEEHVRQRRGDAVRAGNHDKLRVAVQVVSIPCRLLAGLVRLEYRGEDVRVLGLVADALVDLRLDPRPKGEVVPVEEGGALEEGEQPGEVGEEGNVVHVCADGVEDVGLVAGGEHVGRFVEGEVLHDVEDEEVEPLGHVEGSVGAGAGEYGEERGDGVGDARVVVGEGLGAEGLVPDFAAAGVLALVAGHEEGGAGLEKSVPWPFGDGGLGAVDGFDGLGVGDG